ncbi:peptidoglycan amidohydrolase family protein [Leuconostoc pseudomesenteroides]|uniref:peptidoglycan amidohydrolase family protein n=1 Tax=Leuconostoc pseudomesenteroides TaxID=33968 RepID=UPI0032DE7387
MAFNINTAVNEAKSWIGRSTYSMQWNLRDGVAADGTTYFDCSAFIYHILNVAGAIDKSYLARTHYTGTLRQDLTSAGFTEVPIVNGVAETKAGDIYIWGDNYGSGAGGVSHTGMFVDDNNNQISSSWYTAGAKNQAVLVLDHDMYWNMDQQPEFHFFRYTGKQDSAPVSSDQPQVSKPSTYNDKFRAGGGEFTFSNTDFIANEVFSHAGIDQIADYRTVDNKKDDFSRDDNGLPLPIMSRVDGGDNNNVNVGAKLRFDGAWAYGTIDEYIDDAGENGYVGINFHDYGTIYFDSKFAYEY